MKASVPSPYHDVKDERAVAPSRGGLMTRVAIDDFESILAEVRNVPESALSAANVPESVGVVANFAGGVFSETDTLEHVQRNLRI